MVFTPDTQEISLLRILEKLIGGPPSSVHNWSLSEIKMQKEAKKGDLNDFPASGYSQTPETGRN